MKIGQKGRIEAPDGIQSQHIDDSIREKSEDIRDHLNKNHHGQLFLQFLPN